MNLHFLPSRRPRHNRRKLRNYLLDTRLQLRLVAHVVFGTAAAALVFGLLLWRTSVQLFEEADRAVDARVEAAKASQALEVARLGRLIVDYVETDWALLGAQQREIEARFEREKAQALAQRELLTHRHRVTLRWLALGLPLFVLGIAAASLVATHKIAGPLYRIRRLLEAVCAGRLDEARRPLRKGDGLRDLYGLTCRMLEHLADQDREEAEAIAAALRRTPRPQRESELGLLLVQLEGKRRARLTGAPPPSREEGVHAPEGRIRQASH